MTPQPFWLRGFFMACRRSERLDMIGGERIRDLGQLR